ncbi:MAG: NAD(P)-dependent alcohol dehydrogenase, partial [Legionellaceae bacterium]|nr:NAD(P)-dependent alcohol dehydrogenase [Legionellaceae bacterium]
ESFVLRVDASFDLKKAAPLLCAGITTYSPLKRANVKKGSRVGIIGFGGLGHMAVKIAHAMAADVTVFTTHVSKADAAKQLGANDVVVSTDNGAMSAHANQYDFILNTVSATVSLEPYLNLLKHDGQLTQVGLPTKPLPVSMFPMIFKRLNVSGSLIGGIQETQDMLDFCAKHNISADIELIHIKDLNTALKRLEEGEMSRRFVIDMNTLAK